MSDKSDIVIVGAGHNALIAGAYLARGGLSVTVLEERDMPGGGVATAETTLPGFRHDLASSFHIELQTNPLISVDELELMSKYGLRYVHPDPVVVMQPDTPTPLIQRRRLEDTVEQIGKYSRADAAAYRQWIADWEQIRPAYIKNYAASPEAPIDVDPVAAAKLGRIAAMSGQQLVEERFQDQRTRQLMFGNALGNYNLPGSGLLPLSFAGQLSTSSWVAPIGGSNSLTTALVAAIEARGGRVVCNQLVNRILVEGGCATAAVTLDGARYDARHAVISSAHITQLAQLLGPGYLPSIFEETLVNWRSSPAGFVIHLDVKGDPKFKTPEGPRSAVMGIFGTAEGALKNLRDADAGLLPGKDRWMAAFSFTSVDPSRAPAGHSVIKMFVYTPYALNGDPANWEGAREKFADELIETYASAVEGYEPGSELTRTIVAPPDLQRLNRAFIRGDFLGGEMVPNQTGAFRPVKGWAGYRMPIPGLFQVGASAHPSGGVNGWSGRNAAKIILDDLGISSRDFMAPAGEPDTLPPVSV